MTGTGRAGEGDGFCSGDVGSTTSEGAEEGAGEALSALLSDGAGATVETGVEEGVAVALGLVPEPPAAPEDAAAGACVAGAGVLSSTPQVPLRMASPISGWSETGPGVGVGVDTSVPPQAVSTSALPRSVSCKVWSSTTAREVAPTELPGVRHSTSPARWPSTAS